MAFNPKPLFTAKPAKAPSVPLKQLAAPDEPKPARKPEPSQDKAKAVGTKLFPKHLAILDRIARTFNGPKPSHSAILRWLIEDWSKRHDA